MKQLRLGLALLALFCTLLVVHAQTPQITAEAINQANLRAEPGLDFDIVGQIVSGTRYPVIGRSEFYPWVLVANPATLQPIGWVFNDLVSVQGDVNSLPFSTQVIDGTLPTPTLTPTLALSPNATVTMVPPTAGASPPPVGAVIGTVLGEINVRYGPGTEYDRIGVAVAGDTFVITARHTQLPWVQISYPASPNGLGWIAADLLDIQGSLDSVQQITQTTFILPTLTPTPSLVEQAAVGDISPEFAQLGAKLWDRLLAADFDPQTSRLGALFLMNLKTGETLAFEPNIAFSGMSINKIAILATLFGRINETPDDATATTIAESMICSENISTNRLLARIGDGNPYTGAERVSDFLQKLGLTNTFIYTPYSEDPFITPQAPHAAPHTQADQISAEPDPYNQMTVSDIGALLHDMYTCATDGTGALLDEFPGLYSQTECRKMLDVMSYNHIYNFIEAGVPDGLRVAHKHGWIPDTHGDAGIAFTPGGDFILVVALHNPTWLEFSDSVPVISESSRDVYNYLNPDAPLDEIHTGDVPECNLLGNPAILDMLSPTFGETSLFQ